MVLLIICSSLSLNQFHLGIGGKIYVLDRVQIKLHKTILKPYSWLFYAAYIIALQHGLPVAEK